MYVYVRHTRHHSYKHSGYATHTYIHTCVHTYTHTKHTQRLCYTHTYTKMHSTRLPQASEKRHTHVTLSAYLPLLVLSLSLTHTHTHTNMHLQRRLQASQMIHSSPYLDISRYWYVPMYTYTYTYKHALTAPPSSFTTCRHSITLLLLCVLLCVP